MPSTLPPPFPVSPAATSHQLGMAQLQQKNYPAALAHLQQAIAQETQQPQSTPQLFTYLTHAGVAACQLGQLEQGIDYYQQALNVAPHPEQPTPDIIDTRYNLALALHKHQQLDAAQTAYQQVLQQHPQYVPAWVQLGNLHQQQQRYEDAIAQYQNAIALHPNHVQAQYNLGVALQAVGQFAPAETAYRQVLALHPHHIKACNGLGSLLERRGLASQSIAQYQRALAIDPNDIPALLNLANVHARLEQWQPAIALYHRVLHLHPQHLKALDGLLIIHLATAQWQELATLQSQWWNASQTQTNPISLLTSLHLPFTAAEQHSLAQRHAQAIAQETASTRQALNFVHPPEFKIQNSKFKIRLGYVSGDFRYHAVAQLMLRLFELHDRQRFEVFAYSLGPDDGSSHRQKLMADCDRFHDFQGHSPAAAAQQIYNDGIDILIDLAGYTDYACPEIFALRPAPIQINYLGYPGTLGADYIDYIITDAIITPPHLESSFTERCIYLPHSYQINNNQQPIPSATTKADWGLPDAFVFCCFNKVQKIEPTIFAAWMQILAQVPDSVLWLLESNPEAQARLVAAAIAHAIAPDRLIFAPRLPKAQHLDRHAVADLFLDTLHYGAHTTGSDTLWAGVPLITVLGETFAARVSASLLHAVNLPQLVVKTLPDYQALAIRLATHPDELRSLQHHLQSQRSQLPLFDSEQTVRHLEQAYQTCFQKRLQIN
jgi:protein O-GlcNAc transferase